MQKAEKKRADDFTMKSIEQDTTASKRASHFKLKAMAHSNCSFSTYFRVEELIRLLKAYDQEMPKKSTKAQLCDKLYTSLIDDTCTGFAKPGILDCKIGSQSFENVNLPSVMDDREMLVSLSSTEGQSFSNPQSSLPGPSDETASYSNLLSATRTEVKTSSISLGLRQFGNKQSSSGKGKSLCRKGAQQRKRKGKKSTVSVDESSEESYCSVCNKLYVDGENWICCDACLSWMHRICVNIDDDDWNHFSSPDAVYICPMCL